MKLTKTYEPATYEGEIYELWEKSGAFKPSTSAKAEHFSLAIPPPNANGNLHLGHVLTFNIEDIVVRYQRMTGKSTLCIPGADHAGFETWVVYEKQLAKEGKTRFDFNREELYQRVWDFVAANRLNYQSQLRALGLSCDWERFTFTLDAKVVSQANGLFKQMWDDKLIYRGERLVNYCTFHGTSFADIEVVYRRERGKLWEISYPFSDGNGQITVATTRPETMLGDTAVAVHPDDNRYKKLVGKTVLLPLSDREIPVIADEMVDMNYGTGAVKITPAHDPNDFAVAERHSLTLISVIGTDGTINDNAPRRYRGLAIAKARDLVVDDLESAGLLLNSESLVHSVGHCYKCDTVIESLLMDQWFVSMEPLAKQAIKALEDNQIKFYPAAKRDQAISYLENLRDWNISRQIPWGIPIPAFQNENEPSDWIYSEDVEQPTISVDGKLYHRDPDVFDTWFSSAQWPYVTLDYPKGTDYHQYYPLSLMETGGEIFYQWVCRMIMLGLYVTDKVPFKEVYLHGYVLAEDGAKMSKSVGNVIDPLPLIPKYGADALRIGLVGGRSAGVNRGYDQRRIEEGRNFCNKLWNVARFIEDKIGDEPHLRHNLAPSSAADHWILAKLNDLVKEITNAVDNYQFSEGIELLYHFIWDDLADWYIEASKVELNKSVLAHTLEVVLKLAHPFAPFLTETVWQTLKWEKEGLLIKAEWPKPATHLKTTAEFDRVRELVKQIRFIRATLKLNQSLALTSANSDVDQAATVIKQLANLSSLDSDPSTNGLKIVVKNQAYYLAVDEAQVKQFKSELDKQLTDQLKLVKQLKERLANSTYVKNAPPEIVSDTREQLKGAEASLNDIEDQLKQIS